MIEIFKSHSSKWSTKLEVARLTEVTGAPMGLTVRSYTREVNHICLHEPLSSFHGTERCLASEAVSRLSFTRSMVSKRLSMFTALRRMRKQQSGTLMFSPLQVASKHHPRKVDVLACSASLSSLSVCIPQLGSTPLGLSESEPETLTGLSSAGNRAKTASVLKFYTVSDVENTPSRKCCLILSVPYTSSCFV